MGLFGKKSEGPTDETMHAGPANSNPLEAKRVRETIYDPKTKTVKYADTGEIVPDVQQRGGDESYGRWGD